MSGAAARPVRLGLLGCGVIAYWTHLRNARRLPGATLVAAADPDPAARERATRLARVPVHSSAEELLARDDVDAVVIAAPTQLHAELAVACSDAGKHFYLEKPIATCAADAERVQAAAAATRITAVMGFNRRCHPLYELARRLLTRGRIGAVRAVQTTFCEWIPPAAMPAWKRRRATGGGVLLDLATHHVDTLRWLLADEVETVAARIVSEASEHDGAWLDLTMRRGVRVQSVFSFRAALADTVTLVGERGTLRIDRHRPMLALSVPRRLGYGTRRAWVMPSSAVAAWWVRRAYRPSYEPSYRRALAAFVGAVAGLAATGPTLMDGIRALDVVLAAEESARIAAPVRVGHP